MIHLYYCHPYSSWERGTNEATNKMVRCKVPKGINFDDKTYKEIEEIEGWTINMPKLKNCSKKVDIFSAEQKFDFALYFY